MELSSLTVQENSWVINKSLSKIKLRSETGVTLLALKRGKDIIEHPSADFTFMASDIIYIIGNPEQLAYAVEFFSQTAAEKDVK